MAQCSSIVIVNLATVEGRCDRWDCLTLSSPESLLGEGLWGSRCTLCRLTRDYLG